MEWHIRRQIRIGTWLRFTSKLEIYLFYVFVTGLGQFGIAASQTLELKSLILSDFHHNVLNTLDLNIKINLQKIPEDEVLEVKDKGFFDIILLNLVMSNVWPTR